MNPNKTPIAIFSHYEILQVDACGADGKTLDTTAVQKAIEAGGAAGGGLVELPAGTCLNLRVEAITLENSPGFHRAPADSPNTDAMDPGACRYLLVENCTLDVGDDNIVLMCGHLDALHPGAACTDILVTNCTSLHGHGMSIGSET